MSYKQKVKEMYDMLSQGQMMDAFEKYYAENVVTLKQVAVQRWNGDQIVDEKFYHR